MDALALTYLASDNIKSNEKKTLTESFNKYVDTFEVTNVNSGSMSPFTIISTIISIVIGCIAATLSWNCNTVKGVDTGLKIIFAFFAFLFGLIYIILYLIFLSDCTK
jgi:hypothetical protein